MSEEVIKKIEELEKIVHDEVNARKQLARAVIKLSDKFEEHVKGGMSIEELQTCLQKVNELVGILQQAGIGVGEGGQQNMLAQILALQRIQQQQAGDTEIKAISSAKTKKLKKLLEDDEEDDEDEGEDEDKK